MKLRKISNDFTPLHKGLLFGVDTESDTPSDLMVDIIDSKSGEVVATQQLHKVCQAEVNIAPYIERFSERTPSQATSSIFTEAPTTTHYIRVEGVASAPITTSVNLHSTTPPAIVGAMPLSRNISRGERDEILLLVGAGDALTATFTTDSGEEFSLDYTSASGVALLTLVANDFDESARVLEIEIDCNGVALGTLRYAITPNHKGATRLAWISELGSIERYTFPTVGALHRKAEKRVISTLECQKVVRTSTECSISLQSHYEPRATIATLAEIISSPKVWIESRSGVQEVIATTSSIEHSLFNEPDCISLTISTQHREEVVC